jgi:hypothetical protein
MPEHSVARRQPQPCVDPITPLLRAQAARGDVVASHESVLPPSEVDQSKILLHADKEDIEVRDSEAWSREKSLVDAA